jgi:hypothetical protein
MCIAMSDQAIVKQIRLTEWDIGQRSGSNLAVQWQTPADAHSTAPHGRVALGGIPARLEHHGPALRSGRPAHVRGALQRV